jgi:hypothetical protein
MPKFTMSDGREFTDYRPSCELNEMIQKKYNIVDSHKFRHYLQKHGEQVKKDLADCTPKQNCVLCPVCQMALDKK